MKFVVSIDQSTQGTKALLLNEEGKLICRKDIPHEQKIDENGWVSHDPSEIYNNVIKAIRLLIDEAKINKNDICCMGISNQRETTLAWNRSDGQPVCDAIVWQCSRSKDICKRICMNGNAEEFYRKSGIPISPYFPASKLAWIIENIPEAKKLKDCHNLCMGTIDTWLVYKLTGGKEYKTDYSNASRTSMMNLENLKWDADICQEYGIEVEDLAEICDSDSCFGMTDLNGILETPIPICGVLGDSHAALFGHGCLSKGSAKATFGTGTSVMMNIGESPQYSTNGLVTSLAWKFQNKVNYVMEGNLNYTGAVISWLKNELCIISNAAETEHMAYEANPDDTSYLVPAFTGLGAPYWNDDAQAIICGMTRLTGRNEIVKAALECISYQITDVIKAMENDTGIHLKELCVDGGASGNSYIIQLLSDLLRTDIARPEAEELSGLGAGYMAGLSSGVFGENVFQTLKYNHTSWNMDEKTSIEKYKGWKKAVSMIA